jgi:subtilisin-like proprotein convertase family protein
MIELEGMESRTLLSTSPAPSIVNGSSPINLSTIQGNGPNANQNSPVVAVDPVDPSKIVAVWVNNDTPDISFTPFTQVFIEGDYSIDGGKNWNTFLSNTPNGNEPFLIDPASPPTSPYEYQQITDPSVGFDRNGNFYILMDEHSGNNGSGALVLQKYSFAAGSPIVQRYKLPTLNGASAPYNIIKQWIGGNIAVAPTMAVDDNVASFTDPTTGEVQTDLNSGNIYVAWSGTITQPAATLPSIPAALYNTSPILLMASSNGGQTFSAPAPVNTVAYDNQGLGTQERDASPQIIISQGRLPDQSGQQGDAGIPGGQVTVAWNDYGANQNQIMANTITQGQNFQFNDTTATLINAGTMAGPSATVFNVNVSLTAAQINSLDALSVNLAITDSTDATLSLILFAPVTVINGQAVQPFITLFAASTVNVGGTQTTLNPDVRGISGTNVGVQPMGPAVGTIFTDNAAESITDINPVTAARGDTGPYIGNYTVENDQFVSDPYGRSLDAFLRTLLTSGYNINGQWTLEAIDNSTSAPSTPAFLNYWTLGLSTGQHPDVNVVAVNPTFGVANEPLAATVIGGPTTNLPVPVYPTAVPSSPISIGPGLVLASDNTLGSFSPFQGRIYAAFVGYYDVTVEGFKNPTTNTDIFLSYSDDGGRSWSTPVQVNDDSGVTDGFSGANNDPGLGQVDGRSQYMPEVAVDPTTGTLVISWRDARDDAANARVATYLTTSVDGGNTFSSQVYANPQKTAINAITGATQVLGPMPDNESGGNNKTDTAFGYGDQMGLAVYDGQLYPVWAGNFNQGSIVNGAVQGPFEQIFYQPMVIASGPLIAGSTQGPITTQYTFTGTLTKGLALVTGLTSTNGLFTGQAIVGPGIPDGTTIYSINASANTITLSANATASGAKSLSVPTDYYANPAEPAGTPISFNVTFDVPIDPPGVDGATYTPTFTPADVLVFYHDTTNGDPSIPLRVLTVTPVASSGVGAGDRFGFTEFTVTFDPTTQPDGASSGILNYTGTYSYAILPDANGTPIVQPIRSFVATPTALPTLGPIPSKDVGLRVPSSGTGGSGTIDDITTSTLTVANANYADAVITSLTVNMTLDHQRDGDLYITLTAPNGTVTVLYENSTDNGVNFVNTTFSDAAPQSILNGTAPYSNPNGYQPLQPLANLNGSQVNGTYTLTIDDYITNNIGELVNWSITINSAKTSFGLQSGAGMDQNADGTSDENPLTTPFTGKTPGDAYVVPTPQPATTVTFFGTLTTPSTTGIFSPPFNQNTLPLIVSGPQVAGVSVPSGTGSDNLITNGSTSTLDVTFDRPIDVSSFTPSQILQIMGPTGSISGVQPFPVGTVDQVIPAATSTANGSLSSTISVPNSDGTFLVGDTTISLNITAANDANLTGILIAPNGTKVTLFANVPGKNFTGTLFDDGAETSISNGTAPYTGSFQPLGLLSSLLGSNASGTWTLQVTNSNRTASAVLVNWSLNLTPLLSVTPLNEDSSTKTATQFQIGFPLQQLSGTYTIQLSPTIEDAFGDQLDSNQNAGLAVVRDQGQNNPTTTVQYVASDLPKTIPAPSAGNASQVTSTIEIPDNFVVQGDTTTSGVSGLRVQLNLSYPVDADLSATLYYDYGTSSQVGVPLFTNVGTGTHTANFTNTVFDDNAGTPIQNGSAPFFATFNPQMPLSAFAGLNAAGTWTLVVQNSATGSGSTGTIKSWSLSFQKPAPTTGLGEPGSDNANLSFRIFTLSQEDALSSQEWTSVGPAAITGAAGQVSIIAVDKSDPSGNTVYVAGASGGIWKTTNFLTTNPNGPTYIPLTNFGPSSGINIQSIAVFPRNNNTNQSIVIAGTGSITGGEDHTTAPGVGFLISMDGGATWSLLDSTDNVDSSGNILPVASASRDREFVGSVVNQVVVDPQLSPTGQVIIYAALSGTNGGVWRSENTGHTWQLLLSGNATSVVLDPNSGAVLNPDTDTQVQGNLQVVYAGFASSTSTQTAAGGVYISPNQGNYWTEMNGGVGNPLIVNGYNNKNVNPATTASPNGAGGRIVLTVPAQTSSAVQNQIYSGWLYAAVSTSAGAFDGLYMTKDFGENWTQVGLTTLPELSTAYQPAIPTNDITQEEYPIAIQNFGNVYLTLTIDPTNPNIVYLGGFGGNNYPSGTGLVRVDTTNIWDAHDLVAGSNFAADGGSVDLTSETTTSSPSQINNVIDTPPYWLEPLGTPALFYTPNPTSYANFIRNPDAPFLQNSTLLVYNYNNFTNNGAGVTWIPFDMPGTSYQAAVSEVDPTTGLPRLIFGNSQGVWSVLDNNGTFETTIGGFYSTPDLNRNGNLSITQFYDGAAQPSNAAALIAGALFYGAAQDNGAPFSNPDILTTGNLQWNVPVGDVSQNLDSSSVTLDQQGLGTVVQFWFPGTPTATASYTDFLTVNGVGSTFGLLQQSNGFPTPDPQWPIYTITSVVTNPVNGNDIVISSDTGNIFATTNGGKTWFDIGAPTSFGLSGSNGNASLALAYGAPDPNAPNGVGNLGNFIYVGTATGQIYETQVGGGTSNGTVSNTWTLVGSTANGLDGSQVRAIVTSPVRGSHLAYALTDKGVYEITNSVPSTSNPTPKWINLTGNIFQLSYDIFGQTYDPTTDPNATNYELATILTSMVADWNYTIPNSATDPAGAGYHPALFVSANSGVFLSVDDGKTWSSFPSTTYGAVVDGGYLPHVNVTSLSPSLGNIDSNTGMPNLAGPLDPTNPTDAADPDLLLASTFGQGSFAINLAPILFPSSTALDPTSVSGTAADGTPLVTTTTPLIDGLSELTGFGNATRITIVDETPGDSTFGQVIGGFDPSNVAGTNVAANWTSSLGTFSIAVNSGVFTSNGLKSIEVYATDDAGSVGNKVTLSFTLDVAGISPPSAPVTPTLQLITTTPGYTNNPTPELTGSTSSNATVELFQLIGGVPTPFSPVVVTTADSLGNFSFTFPDMTGGMDGTFGPYSVVAQASNNVGSSGYSTPPTTFTIIVGSPSAPSNFMLAAGSDTGIVGDNVTSDRTPVFTGSTLPGATVELFELGSSTIYSTVTANASGIFTIQLPFTLTNGSISLYVEAVDQAGNQSAASNILTVRIVSIAADYNADSYTDAALYNRSTTTFTGTLTSGSPVVTGLSSLTGLVSGVAVSGTGVPSGATIASVNTTGFTGTLLTGSSLVTGIASTSGLYAGENISGPGIPAGATILGITSSTAITLSANATATGAQSLTATAITLSANATASGVQTLTANPGLWLVKTTSEGPASPSAFWFPSGTSFGPGTVTPFQGDFDGDGYTDLAYYQASSSSWYMYDSKSGNMSSFTMTGTNSTTLPVAGYFDANGPDEPAVYTIVNGQGVWSIVSAISGLRTTTFGLAGDIPVPGNYDGLGYDELAVYRPSTGNIYVLQPGGATETLNLGVGSSPDLSFMVPVPAAYDNLPYTVGEVEKTEAAVFDRNTGVFTILGPNGVYTVSSGFQKGDIPAPGDYLGEGEDQPVVFRPSTGQFIAAGGTVIATFGAGASADIPLTSPLYYRMYTGTSTSPGLGTGTTGTGTGTGTTGTGSTGTGTGSTGTGTGTGTTGTGSGSGTTGSTGGSGGTSGATGSTGSSSSGQGSTGSSSSSSTTSATSPAASSHTKKVVKIKKVSHPKKVAKPAKPKKAETKPPAKTKAKAVKTPVKKTVKVVAAHPALAAKSAHVVDKALESLHVNVLRKSTKKKA